MQTRSRAASPRRPASPEKRRESSPVRARNKGSKNTDVTPFASSEKRQKVAKGAATTKTSTASAARFAMIYWPLFLVVGTVVAAVVMPPPALSAKAGREMGLQEASPKALLLSPLFLFCMALLGVGIYAAESVGSKLARSTDPWEKMISYWHLTNAAWWSFGCDFLSGGVGLMPNLSVLYLAVDAKHTKGVAMRSALDAVYWSEISTHVPISWLCFYLYIHQAKSRRLVEAFLSGVQLMGTYAYYFPEIIEAWHRGTFEGGNWPFDDPLLFGLGIGFGIMWVVFPIVLLVRAIRMV